MKLKLNSFSLFLSFNQKRYPLLRSNKLTLTSSNVLLALTMFDQFEFQVCLAVASLTILMGFIPRLLKSFAAYRRALTLDPKHIGAHEYIGIAYVQSGQLDKAREHLAILDKLCSASCEEYRDLKEAVERAAK